MGLGLTRVGPRVVVKRRKAPTVRPPTSSTTDLVAPYPRSVPKNSNLEAPYPRSVPDIAYERVSGLGSRV
eukprot:2964503-Rhodomonas_salina.1